VACLLDTNILLRLVVRTDPEHALVRSALRTLRLRGEQRCYLPQNLVEFWSVCTRPAAARGGYGMTLSEADENARIIERLFILLPESPALHAQWRQLIMAHGVQGVQVHDARLVAAMRVHGITRILTLNPSDFSRYAGITAVHPDSV
jgi:predicted nucleic acid-binding protein